MHYLSPLNLASLREKIAAERARVYVKNVTLDALAEHLQYQNGMSRDKRMIDRLRTDMHGYDLYWDKDRDTLHVYGGPHKLEFRDAITVRLYTELGNRRFDYAKTHREEIERAQEPDRPAAMLAIERDLTELVDNYNTALENLNVAQRAFGAASYCVDWKTGR